MNIFIYISKKKKIIMQHLSTLLNYKKLDIKEILSSPCTITLKLDGNAFQSVYKDNRLSFHKRPYSPDKEGQELNEIDTACYTCYNNAYSTLRKYESILKNYEIINFEILDNEVKHIIKNTKKVIVLLSAYKRIDGELTEVDRSELRAIVTKIPEITIYPALATLVTLNEDFIDCIISSANKGDYNDVWKYFCDLLRVNPKAGIEGFVLEFFTKEKKRTYKLVSPLFKSSIDEHLEEEKRLREDINLEDVYSFIINSINTSTKVKMYSKNHTYFQTLLYMYIFLENSHFFENNLININNKLNLLKLDQLNDIKINKYFVESYINEKTEFKYINILNFIIIGFRNKREQKPLWCSIDFQKNTINPFIDYFNNI